MKSALLIALIIFLVFHSVEPSRKSYPKKTSQSSLDAEEYTISSDEKYHLARFALRHYRSYFDKTLNPEFVRINGVLSTQVARESNERMRVQMSVDVAEPSGSHTGIFRIDVSGGVPIVNRQGRCNSCTVNGVSFFPLM
jgi:hypothetical protein